MIAKVKRPHLSQVQLRTLERLATHDGYVARSSLGAEGSTMLALSRRDLVTCVNHRYAISERGRQHLATRLQKRAR